MQKVKNYHGIIVKYLPPTNYKGSRVKLTSLRFNDSVTLSYDYAFNVARDQAVSYLQKYAPVIGVTESWNGNGPTIVLLDTVDGRFTSLKNMVNKK